jgi:hypothetical protein
MKLKCTQGRCRPRCLRKHDNRERNFALKEIVDLARKSGGTTDFIIAQESYQGKTSLECTQKDFAITKG